MNPAADVAGRLAIREVRPEEYDALGDLTVAAYRSSGELDPGYLEHIHDVGARAAVCPVLVAVDASGRVLGGVTYVPGPGTPYSEVEREGEAGFRMLAVDPAAQGLGVGRRLVVACLERARRDGRHRDGPAHPAVDDAAHRLYESLGFRRDPERDWWPEDDLELLAFAVEFDRAG